MARKKYKIIPDAIVSLAKGTGKKTPTGRVSPDPLYLEDILDDIASCNGGFSSCQGGLILFGQDDGKQYRIYANGGQLVLANDTDSTSTNITALP